MNLLIHCPFAPVVFSTLYKATTSTMNTNSVPQNDESFSGQSSPFPPSRAAPLHLAANSSSTAATVGDDAVTNRLNQPHSESAGDKESNVISWRGFCEREKCSLNWDPKKSTVLSKKNRDIKLDNIKLEEVGFYDVLYIGRGGTGYKLLRKKKEHSGYIWYRSMIEIVRPGFLLCKGKKERMKLSRWIVNKVREFGGRFIHKDKKTGLYHDVGDSTAQMRTSMALRDQRRWKTLLQACADDFDHYGKYLVGMKLENIFRECDIDILQLHSLRKLPPPSAQSRSSGVQHAAGPALSIFNAPISSSMTAPYRNNPSLSMHTPSGMAGLYAGFPSSDVTARVGSTTIGGSMGPPNAVSQAAMLRGPFISSIGPPRAVSRAATMSDPFLYPPQVQPSQQLMVEQQALQQGIMRGHQSMLIRQEMLARTEAEQRSMLERSYAQQYQPSSSGDLQRYMMERQIMRQKLREEMMMQEQLDARLMQREVAQRSLLYESFPSQLYGSIASQPLGMQHKMAMQGIPQHQPSSRDQEMVERGWISRQELLREQTKKGTTEATRRLERRKDDSEASEDSSSDEDETDGESESESEESDVSQHDGVARLKRDC